MGPMAMPFVADNAGCDSSQSSRVLHFTKFRTHELSLGIKVEGLRDKGDDLRHVKLIPNDLGLCLGLLVPSVDYKDSKPFKSIARQLTLNHGQYNSQHNN